MNDFEVLRYRFRLTALDDVHFPAGATGNIIRGAFGLALRETAPAVIYERLFEPKAQPGAAPSGLSDLPRPFVFRWFHHHGSWTLHEGDSWDLTIHLFDPAPELPKVFGNALAVWKQTGIGLRNGSSGRRGRLRLDGTETLSRASILLDTPEPARRAAIEFWSPTELKNDGQVAERPEFPILFSRLRDRIATLRSLYQSAPLKVDFRGLGERAQFIQIRNARIGWESVQRTSSRTGQTHPIGGFTGAVEYEGELAEFLPWLRGGEFTGVGRQTTWGKGDLRVAGVTES